MTTRLTKLERAVVRARARARAASARAEAARDALGDSCTHPAEYVEPWQWEHDNGYGRQTKYEGWWCSLCLARNHWKRPGAWQYLNNQREG